MKERPLKCSVCSFVAVLCRREIGAGPTSAVCLDYSYTLWSVLPLHRMEAAQRSFGANTAPCYLSSCEGSRHKFLMVDRPVQGPCKSSLTRALEGGQNLPLPPHLFPQIYRKRWRAASLFLAYLLIIQ